MKIAALKGKRIVIWGTGREGLAAAEMIHAHLPEEKITFVDEAAQNPTPQTPHDPVIRGIDAIAETLKTTDILIKSPGVPLYHPVIQDFIGRGGMVTSLLNMWLANKTSPARVICVTGTKGKSTTSSLIDHMIRGVGRTCALVGNIGVPVTQIDTNAYDFIVTEVSSYQAANLTEPVDIGVLTSLYPEHLDWHGSVDRYYADKLNLLAQARTKILNTQTRGMVPHIPNIIWSNDTDGIHARGHDIYDDPKKIGTVLNRYVAHDHNMQNLCTAICVMKQIGLDITAALATTHNFQGLPHRQFELGVRDGLLFVDDSISTTPQSAIAALETYRDRIVTILLGGYDRGIDYTPLTHYIQTHTVHNVICMGPSGTRIFDALRGTRNDGLHLARDMKAAVDIARAHAPINSVILLSPAAPSYDVYKDFTYRGRDFAEKSGF